MFTPKIKLIKPIKNTGTLKIKTRKGQHGENKFLFLYILLGITLYV